MLRVQAMSALQDVFHDHYALRMDMTDRGQKFPAEYIVASVKPRCMPMILELLDNVNPQTHALWLDTALGLIRHWDTVGYDDNDEGIHLLITLITVVNTIMIKHWSEPYFVMK